MSTKITTIRREVRKVKFDGLDETAESYIKNFEKKLILDQKSPNTINGYLFTLKSLICKKFFRKKQRHCTFGRSYGT